MAINKNFVVKNGIEVNTNLIVADTDSNKVGIGTTVPEYTLHVFEGAGIGVTNITVTGISTNLDELNVGVGGTTLTAISNATLGIGGSVGVGTDAPGYLLEVHSPVSTGQTALYVKGDMRVTGDINIDDISIGDINVSGISTFDGNILIGTGATVGFGSTAFFKDHAKAIFGDGEDLKIYHDGSNSFIQDSGSGGLYFRAANTIGFRDAANSFAAFADFNSGGSVDLYYDGTKRFETNAIGVEVSGTFESTGITTLASDAGITTTGGDLYVGGDLYINEDIVLDTNLNILGIATIGDLHVTGVSTFDGTIKGPNLTNSVVVGTGLSVHGSTTGVAVTLAGAGGITTTGGDLYVGGDLFITEDITLDTNLSILGIATIGTLNLSSTSGINTIDSTVQSTSKDTGSLVLEGGLGVEKSVFIGDGLDVTGIATVHGGSIDIANAVRHIGDPDTHVSFPTADEVQIQTGGTPRLTIGSGGISTFSGVIDSNDTTQSTSATTGSAQFAGGVGIEKQLYVGAGASVGAGFTIGTGIGVTTILDDDTFNNASAGALASQQSIKAYVDAQITAEDLDFAGDSGTGAVDLDSQSLTIAGTANEIETSASSQTLTIGLPNDVTIGQDFNVTRNTVVTGIATFQSHVHLGNDDELRFGDKVGGDMIIVHDGDHGQIDNNDGNLNIKSEGNIEFNPNNTADGLRIINQGAVEAFFNNSKKFETTGVGVTVIGVTTSRGFVVAPDDAIHFNRTAADNNDAILRASANSGQLLINSRNDVIINIDSNDNDTGSHFGIGHNDATGSSTELFRVQEDGVVGVNTDRDFRGLLSVFEGTDFNTGSQLGIDNIYLASDATSAEGAYGASIAWSRVQYRDRRAAAIANVQTTSDEDQVGLAFFTHPNTDAATPIAEQLRIQHDGKVGIGTSVPEFQLHSYEGDGSSIAGLFETNQSDAFISFQANGTTAGSTVRIGAVGDDLQAFVNGAERLRVRSDGGIVAAGIATFSATSHLTIPVGTTNQRDDNVANGMIRYNTTLNSYEGYGNGAWGGLGGGTEIDTAVSSTSATNLTTFAHASYRSASMRIQITQGSSYQVGKYLLIHDGTTVTIVEESAIATGDMLGSISGAINGSNVEVKVTMNSASSATVTTIIDKITV